MYEFITPKEHIITVRNRDSMIATKHRVWNESVIDKILENQKPNEDVFITKYPKNRLVNCLILDFDSEEKSSAYKDVRRIANILKEDGHNCVIVDSTNKGYHLYIQIAPFLFKDVPYRKCNDWDKYFKEFVDYFICHISSTVEKQKYLTKDVVNSNAGLNANIRLIGSIHPSTQERVKIIEGEFVELQKPTFIQDKAQRVAWNFCEALEEHRKEKLAKTQVIDGNDPIQSNDLREIMPSIFGEEIKLYSKGYGFMRCPFHDDKKPSLLVTKEFYSCASCNNRGNVFTLLKKGYVKFDNDGKVEL